MKKVCQVMIMGIESHFESKFSSSETELPEFNEVTWVGNSEPDLCEPDVQGAVGYYPGTQGIRKAR